MEDVDMLKILNSFAVLLCCILLVPFEAADAYLIVLILSAITVNSMFIYLPEKISLALCCGCAVAACFVPYMNLFVPVLVFFLASKRPIYISLICVAPAAAGFLGGNPQQAALVAALSLAAFLFGNLQKDFSEVKDNFKTLQDSMTEQNIDFEYKQKELLELQDYEVRLATLSERNRIAREIHDNVGHLLTRSLLQVGALEVVHKGNKDLEAPLGSLKGTLSDAMDNIRESVHDLHEESIDLRFSVQALISEFSFCPVKLVYDTGKIPKELKYCFLAVIKEALSNIARHSNASSARITILEHPAFYQLTIQDDGTKKNSVDKSGMGLSNVKERIEHFGGTVRFDDKRGFSIFISVPKEKGRKNESNHS